MQPINVSKTRGKLANLLDAVVSGEETIILRHGKPAVRLTPVLPKFVAFADRSILRAFFPPASESAAIAKLRFYGVGSKYGCLPLRLAHRRSGLLDRSCGSVAGDPASSRS
jgi:prevent-host-death family protein